MIPFEQWHRLNSNNMLKYHCWLLLITWLVIRDKLDKVRLSYVLWFLFVVKMLIICIASFLGNKCSKYYHKVNLPLWWDAKLRKYSSTIWGMLIFYINIFNKIETNNCKFLWNHRTMNVDILTTYRFRYLDHVFIFIEHNYIYIDIFMP